MLLLLKPFILSNKFLLQKRDRGYKINWKTKTIIMYWKLLEEYTEI